MKLKTVCVDGRNHDVRCSKTERVAVLWMLTLDFLTSTQQQRYQQRAMLLLLTVCYVGRRVYGARDQTLLFLFLHLGQLNNIKEMQEEMGQCPYQLRTSCLFQSAQVVCHIRLETACSQHAQHEELSAWNQSKSDMLPTFIVSQDTAQLLQKGLGLLLGPTPRSYYSSVYLHSFHSEYLEHLLPGYWSSHFGSFL